MVKFFASQEQGMACERTSGCSWIRPALLTVATLLAGTSAWAQEVQIEGAWARATVPGQFGTGVFMRLKSDADARLVAVSTPAAGVAEVHEMRLQGTVMRMSPIKGGLELPAGKEVQLKPGGYHVMLMDLKHPLSDGSTVDLTLVFKDAKGKEERNTIHVPVQLLPPAPK